MAAGVTMANGTGGKGGLGDKPFVGIAAKTWPDALRWIRVERGFSYRDVANAVCRDRPNDPRSWEMGLKLPDRHDLRRLYNALPKLKNAAHLLPAPLREDTTPADTATPVAVPPGPPEAKPEPAPEVAAAVAAPAPDAVPPAPAPAPAPPIVVPAEPPASPRPTWKTFGEALDACLIKEKMKRQDFAKLVGLSTSNIFAYIAGYRSYGGKRHPVGISHIVYDRILSVLPELKAAPRPRVSSHAYSKVPGKPPAAEAAAAKTVPKGAIARKPEEGTVTRERRPLPPMPETLRKPGLPPPGVAAVKASPMVAVALDKAKAITEAATAWGAALAKCERLRAELAAAEAEVSASYERVQRLVKATTG